MHPHQPNKCNQRECDSEYSRAESFEKTFETNSTENVHKLQKLEDAKVKQMLQNMCVNLMGWVNLMNWMNFVNWLN